MTELKKAVLLKVSGDIEIIDVPEDKDWTWYPTQIGCRVFEHVYPKGLKEPFVLICDEEGRMAERPVINFHASWLYGTQDHGEPIVGDVLIMRQEMTEEGMDDVGMTYTDAIGFYFELSSILPEAIRQISYVLGERLVRNDS